MDSGASLPGPWGRRPSSEALSPAPGTAPARIKPAPFFLDLPEFLDWALEAAETSLQPVPAPLEGACPLPRRGRRGSRVWG